MRRRDAVHGLQPNGLPDYNCGGLRRFAVLRRLHGHQRHGSSVQLVASAGQSTWYPVQPVGLVGSTIRTVSGAATLAASDRFLIITTTAATITIQAPAAYQIGQIYGIDNTTGGSLTLTPASGNIQGVAAYTLTTLNVANVFTDGTNFFLG